MKIKQICLLGSTATLLLAGCMHSEPAPVPPPQPLPPAYSEVTFPVYPLFTEAPLQQDRDDDLMEIVKLGIALGDTGQHEKAANVFLKGAKDFSSKGARLEQAFISAAIMEHFKAGMINLVKDDFQKLDALRTNPYSQYDDNEDIRKLREVLKIK